MPASRSAARTLAQGDAWGKTPFRIGLWVGRRTTPNTTDQSAEAVKLDHGGSYNGGGGGIGTPDQLTNCPWCGCTHPEGQHVKVETYSQGPGRTLTFCGDTQGKCRSAPASPPTRGCPWSWWTRRFTGGCRRLLIATVDKFAQMPWNGGRPDAVRPGGRPLRPARVPLARA